MASSGPVFDQQDRLDKVNNVTEEEQVVADVAQGTEPGASKLDSTLFAADSFEDLSTEIEDPKKLDGECSSRTFSVASGSPERTSITSGDEIRGQSFDTDVFEENEKIEEETKEHPASEINLDEVRKQRAETVVESPRDSIAEDINNPQWASHKKHVFILSEAGKPIYSRYGNEEKLATLMGVMQALVSFVQDNNDNIRSIIAGQHKFVFLCRGPVILVAVCSAPDSTAQLTRIFEHRRNYDLRKLLAGTEKFIDNLINLMSSDASFLLAAVRCLPLVSSVRDVVGQTLQQAKSKDLVFAILVANNQLVTMVRPKRFTLHPSDLHLIFNLVSASTSFKTAESWTPICLPKFDNSGYLYAYVSYLDDNCPACLLLLSTDRNSFFTLADCKTKIKERLDRHKCLDVITRATMKGSYTTDQVGIPDLWHFMYKSRSTAQFTSPDLGPPYLSSEEQERLFGQYLYLHHRIHSAGRPLKMLCHVGPKEMIIGWVTSGFELYTAFSPLTSKSAAMNGVNKLLRWIRVSALNASFLKYTKMSQTLSSLKVVSNYYGRLRNGWRSESGLFFMLLLPWFFAVLKLAFGKREEDRLFIINSYTFSSF